MKYNNQNEYSLLDVFEDFFTNMDHVWAMPSSSAIYSCQFPPLNLSVNEETKDLKFEFALAGYSKDEIDLSFEGDYLKLKIELKTKKDDGFALIQKGIKESSISKKFYVPFIKYQVDKIKVKFDGGILEIIIPAKDAIKPKKLEIK